MIRFTRECKLESSTDASVLLGPQLLIVGIEPDAELGGGQLFDQFLQQRVGNDPHQHAERVGHGRDDPVGEVVLQCEDAGRGDIADLDLPGAPEEG